jgi:hypothetical protein
VNLFCVHDCILSCSQADPINASLYNDGKPLLDADPEHPAAVAYLEIAKIIHPTPIPVMPQETLENNEQIPS